MEWKAVRSAKERGRRGINTHEIQYTTDLIANKLRALVVTRSESRNRAEKVSGAVNRAQEEKAVSSRYGNEERSEEWTREGGERQTGDDFFYLFS